MHALIRRFWLDGVLAFALFAFALAMRLPYLYLVPRWTDEMNESTIALQIARGAHSPLSGVMPYVGPLYPDLLAVLLRVIPSPFVPRALAACLCAAAVVATYALGRVLVGRAGGVVAGILMATASSDIVVNSHIAYGNSTTHLFSTLALTFLVLAQQRASALWLAAAGAMFAFAVQTHPAPLAMAPGLLLWFLLPRSRWPWFRRIGLYAAAFVTLLAYSPVIAAALLQSKQFAFALETRSYAFATDHSPAAYLANMQGFLVEMTRMLGATFRNLDTPHEYLLQPLALAYAVLVPLALVVAARRGRTILPLAIGSAVLLIPYFNYQYEAYPFFTRYLGFMLPLVYVAVGDFFLEVHRTAPLGKRRSVTGALALVAAALVVGPLPTTFQYFQNQTQSGRNNALFLEIARRAGQDPNPMVYVDQSMSAGEFPSGGNLLLAFQSWFDMGGRPYRNLNMATGPYADLCGSEPAYLIAADAATVRLDQTCNLTRVTGATIITRPGRPDLAYSLFQVQVK